MKYSSDLKQEAIHLREIGLSLRQISAELSIGSATAFEWTKEVPFTRQGRYKFSQFLFCKKCSKSFKKKGKKRFCSQTCWNESGLKQKEVNNFVRNKVIKNCTDCSVEFSTYVACKSKLKCDICQSNTEKFRYKSYSKIINCKLCNAEVLAKQNKRKYCEECARIRKSESGKLSVSRQADSRRSKNEMHFASLCKHYFGEELTETNVPMFNGWDADVVIPSKKLAILWNGIWHYQKVRASHSVEDVQRRDDIKIREITNYGYSLYVIKDVGKHDKKFVEKQFEIMLEVISMFGI